MFRNALTAFTVMAALGGTALMPAAAFAQDRDHDRDNQEHRLYDRDHKDYHSWNHEEDRLYHEFLQERHWKYREFDRLNKKQQHAYWQWRHDHERYDRERR